MAHFENKSWIFFDLGSTLWDEAQAAARRLEDIAAFVASHDINVDPLELETGIIARFAEHDNNPIRSALLEAVPDSDLLRQALQQTQYMHDLIEPYAQAEQLLDTLHLQFKLGVIANQPPGIPARLDALGWTQYFEVVAGSGDVGMSKPDPAIFHHALGEAQIDATECVYVGDRIDNDIAPAKALGFGTIRYLAGYARSQVPRDASEDPDATVSNLADIPTLFGLPAN